MSFILDQLKQSGKKRALEMAMRKQAEKPVAITSEPLSSGSTAHTSVSMQKWRFAAVAVLLGAVAVYGVISFLSGPLLIRQPVVPVAKGLVPEASQMPAMPSSGPSIQIPEAQVKAETGAGAKSSAAGQKQTGTEKPVAASDEDRNTSEKAVSGRSTEKRGKRSPGALIDAPVGIEPSDSVEAGSVLAASVVEFKQLSHAVRKSLPEIRVTSHLYRKDSRLVSINGRIMSEGYNMDDGLFLEKITPEGVILSYGKHRFLVRAER